MSNWQKVKIGDFLFERKGRYKPNDEQIVNLPRIEKIDFSGNFHIGNKDSKTDMILIKDGDLVISGINVAKGAMGIYSGEDVTATIHYSSYTFDSNKINVEYFKRFLKSSEFIELINEQVKGGIKTEIKPKHILPLEIQLPDINTQAQIVQHFENVEEDIADITQEVLTGQSLLKQLKQTILQEAIEGKLTAKWRAKNPDIGTAKELLEQIKTEKEKLVKEKKIKATKPLAPINEDEIPFDIPQSWEWCRLGEICNYGSSSKIEPKDIKEDTWILDLEDIEKESSKLLCKTRGNERNSSSTKSVFYKFDVLYSKLRPYLDKVIVADENGVCTTEILPLTFYKNVDSYYAMYALKRKDFLKYANSLTKGMKMPRLGTDDGKNALFPLPPLEEQKEIVATIEKLFTIYDELEGEIKQNKTTVENLMATVLNEAFEDRGKQ